MGFNLKDDPAFRNQRRRAVILQGFFTVCEDQPESLREGPRLPTVLSEFEGFASEWVGGLHMLVVSLLVSGGLER